MCHKLPKRRKKKSNNDDTIISIKKDHVVVRPQAMASILQKNHTADIQFSYSRSYILRNHWVHLPVPNPVVPVGFKLPAGTSKGQKNKSQDKKRPPKSFLECF